MERLDRKDYMTPPEAAEMMMCSKLHVRKLIKERRLPVYKVGTRCYIPRNAVEQYIESKMIPALDGENSQ